MKGRLLPRVLPLAMLAMAGSIAFKSASLVRAAVPRAEAGPESGAAPVKPPPMTADLAKALESPAGKPGGPAAAAQAPEPQKAVVPEIVSEAERTLLADLRQRRAELDERTRALAAREQMLAAAEHRVSGRLDELAALQSRLEQMEAARQAHASADWRAMVKVYEAMKPRDAATIFNDLDRDVLLQILDRMGERRASLVLAAMLPDRARLATVELAAMRARAATPPDTAAR